MVTWKNLNVEQGVLLHGARPGAQLPLFGMAARPRLSLPALAKGQSRCACVVSPRLTLAGAYPIIERFERLGNIVTPVPNGFPWAYLGKTQATSARRAAGLAEGVGHDNDHSRARKP